MMTVPGLLFVATVLAIRNLASKQSYEHERPIISRHQCTVDGAPS